ncbi:MAG: type II secretion system F family protein [Candidatus Omnitrophota bacterium]|nr:type II secretion system F family protein [Candidatus Omnitrophota bacterium]
MAHFNYIVKDENARTVRGREFATSEHELVLRLARKNLTIISIKRSEETSHILRFAREHKHISIFDQMILCRQLSTLLKGGVPLIKGLEIISGETENLAMQDAITEICQYIKQGESFSTAMKRLSHLFSPLFVAMIEAGERVGALDTMLERLSKYMAAQDRLNKKIVSAIAYPAAVFIFFLFAIGVMTLFIIPKFKGMYASFHAKLPPFTLGVFGLSDFLMRHFWFILAGIVFTGIYIKNFLLKTKRGRYAFHALLLKIPVFGPVIKKASLSKFTRTLATLLGQGIPVPEALELVGNTAGNAVVEEASANISKSILDGRKIPDAFRKTGLFPSLVVQMATIGVESGNLPELFDKTADFYEEEIDVFLGIMASLIEPVLIIVLGLVMAVFIIALYLPIFNLSQAMGGGA